MPSGRPIKTKVSGTGYKNGDQGYTHLKYKRLSADGKTYEIDTDTIGTIIDRYIADHEYKQPTNTDNTGDKDNIQERGILSITGLCRALDIGLDTLSMWSKGYVGDTDITDERVTSNRALHQTIRAGTLPIYQYWEECSDKYMAQKHIRLMETHGLISPTKSIQEQQITGTISLGKLRKYAK